MFLELIGVIFAGFAVAGIVMLINRATGGRLPKWLAPVAAGAGMIVVTISSEYGWYDRTRAGLPEGLEVAETVENRSYYRPWTFVIPYVERFAAVDIGRMRTHASAPQYRLFDLYFFGRWSPVSQLTAMADCNGWQRAVVPEATVFEADGKVEGLEWISAPSDDAILSTVCGET